MSPRRPVNRTRRRLAPKGPSETALQMAAWRYLQYALPPEVRAFHVPNGGKRDEREAAKLKAMGVCPGVHDFVFVLPNAQVATIELKVGRNDLSDEQIDWKTWLEGRGACVAVCRSVEEVETVVVRWLAAFQLKPRAYLHPLFGTEHA